jgi:hypothetical protein
MKVVRLAALFVAATALLAFALPAVAASASRNSGFYDHQFIEYESTAEVTSSPHAAQLLSFA